MADITFTNQWECEEYFVGGERIQPETCHELRIFWPDKTPSVHEIRWIKVHGEYGDMGQTVKYTRLEPFIVVEFHGFDLLANLKAFKEAEIIK